MDSLVSPSTQRQNQIGGKPVSYFKYNHPQSDKEETCREREIIDRMRSLDRSLKK